MTATLSNVPLRSPSRAGNLALSCSEAMWLAILLVLPLAMNVSVARSFEATKLMAVAPMAALALGALVAAALERALAPSRHLLTSVPALAFFAFIGSAVLATVASETPSIAFFGDYFRREGLISWLVCAVLFSGLLLCLRHREQIDRLIDVLMVASIAPCVYAIMQRYGFDFFLTAGLQGGTAAARPGGTMGNPTFLASMLLLVIPLTVTRVLAPGAAGRRAPWILLLAVQLLAAVLTQSRGPLIGIALTFFIMLLILGARARARALMMSVYAAVVALGLGLALINSVPALSQASAGTPLQRFVFVSTDPTLDSRRGIWDAGVDSFTHAPWWRKAIGYGPDAASFNYFNWMPPNAQRNEGYSETIDRLHCEFLEILLSFGLLGLLAQITLLSSLVWMGAQHLLPGANRRRYGWIGYAAWLVLGTVAGALLPYLAGASRGLWAIGAGAGLAGAWTLFLAWRGWRALRFPVEPSGAGALPEEALLIAALLSALVGSWVETQVGVPTIVTRALAACAAALLILTMHGAWRKRQAQEVPPAPLAPPQPAASAAKSKKRRQAAQRIEAAAAAPAWGWYPVLGWAAGLALIACVAGFFPPLSGGRMQSPGLGSLALIFWPLILTLLGALWMARAETTRNDANTLRALTHFLLWSVPAPLVYMMIHAALGGMIDGAGIDTLGPVITNLVTASFAAYLALSLLLVGALYLGDRRATPAPARMGGTGAVALAGGLVLCGLAFAQMRVDYGADVAAKLSVWAREQRRPDDAITFVAQAMARMPQERRFLGSYAARQIDMVSAELGQAAKDPARLSALRARLLEVERVVTQARQLAPRDPWLTFSYANVQQFLALRMLASTQTAEERRQHAEESRKYMALAHQQFPGHPWILRNWAQLELDQGNSTAAWAKLEEMERLDPRNLSAYLEIAKVARLDNKPAAGVAAIRRGLAVFSKDSPEAGILYQAMIEFPRDSGRIKEAIDLAMEYAATQPEHVRPWGVLAELYDMAGQPQWAYAYAQQAMQRFAGKKLDGQDATDYANLEALIRRLNNGAAGVGTPAPAPPSGTK